MTRGSPAPRLQGLAPRIENLAEWRAHLLERLRHQRWVTCYPRLAELLAELEAYPCDQDVHAHAVDGAGGVVVPLKLRIDDHHVLSLLSTTTVFGTPREITLAEMAIETFFPADAETAVLLRQAAGS